MADRFNPITDLQPADPFNVPVGESSEEVESIRLKLVVTRNKTAELVNILKKKNVSFKKDIDTIRELNRRLMRTIPRIPILRGDASSQTKRLEELSIRRGQFDIDTTLIPKPDAKIPQRLLNFAVDIILTIYGGKIINLIFKRLGILKLIPPKLLEKITKTKPKKPFEIPIFPNPNVKPPVTNPNVIPLFPNIFNPSRKAAKFNFSNLNIKNFTSTKTIPLSTKQLDVARIYYNKKVSGIQNMLATGNKDGLRILIDNGIADLTTKRISLIEKLGKNLNKTQIGNTKAEISLIDDAIAKIKDIESAAFPKSNIPKSSNALDTILEALKNNKNRGRSGNKKFTNLNKLEEDIQYHRNLLNNNKDLSSLNRDTNTINNIYIVDDDFIV